MIIDKDKHSPIMIEEINLRAIQILKEIQEALKTKKGDNKAKTYLKFPRTADDFDLRFDDIHNSMSLREEAWLKTINDFLNQESIIDHNQMFNLLESAKIILSNPETKWGKSKIQIFKVLEEIVGLGYEKGLFDDHLHQFTDTFNAMVSLDFTKRMPSTSKEKHGIDGTNIFNFFATSLNMVIDALQTKVMPKNIFDTLVTSGVKSQVVFVTDTDDNITFISKVAFIAFKFDNSLYHSSISQLFADFGEIKNQVLLKDQLIRVPTKFLCTDELKIEPKNNSLLSVFTSRDTDGLVNGYIYEINSTEINFTDKN